MRILIVEDDPVCSLVLVKSLASLGEIQTASDGEAGLKAVRDAYNDSRPFDLICLDIMMPKLDGQGLLKAIRGLENEHNVGSDRGAKVIMTTALNDKDNLLEALPRCDAYLTKPIDRSELMFYVQKFGLAGKRAGNETPLIRRGAK